MTDTATPIPSHIQAAVDSPMRTAGDRARDEGRKPAEVMAFFDVQPGQRVAEINTGRGYFTALLSLIVGDAGRVYGITTEASVRRWKGNPLDERIDKKGITNIETSVAPSMDAPGLPGDLDAVFLIMTYHDAIWSGADRSKLNKAVYDALKPGGLYGIIDHHAAQGHGTEDCESIHRVEKSVVVEEVTAAGFQLSAESDVLENPDDPLDAGVHSKEIRDHTHRFVLKFTKPA